MDTQDFVESVKIWTEVFRQNRDPVLDYPPSTDPEEKKWEENMLKIASVLTPADSIEGTPAEKKVIDAVEFAKSRDTSKLKQVYILLDEVEQYLKESLV